MRLNLFLPMLFFAILAFSGLDDLAHGQSINLPNDLVKLLEKKPIPDTTEVKRILSDKLSSKWLLLVDFKGDEVHEVALNFYDPKFLTTVLQYPIINQHLPFLQVFDKVVRDQEIEFKAHKQDGTTITYARIASRCDSTGGCLSYVTLGEGTNDINELTISIPEKINGHLPKRGNWLVSPSIPLLIGNRKTSLLSAFFAASTVGTYLWYRNEDGITENYISKYGEAPAGSSIAFSYYIAAERANSRRLLAKRVSIASGATFLVLFINDVFLQSRPQKEYTAKNKGKTEKHSFRIDFNQDFVNHAISFEASINLGD